MKETVIKFSYRQPKKKRCADDIISDWNTRNGTSIKVGKIMSEEEINTKYPPRIRLRDSDFIDLSTVPNYNRSYSSRQSDFIDPPADRIAFIPKYSDYETLSRVVDSGQDFGVPLPKPKKSLLQRALDYLGI